ncbi:MAG: alpha/beta hydrolase [Myxococcota bacterium]
MIWSAVTVLILLVAVRLVTRLRARLDHEAVFERLPVRPRPKEQRAHGTLRGVRLPGPGGAVLDAWLLLPNTPRPPIVVMAPGMGLAKDVHLEPLAWRFVASGVAALIVDFRTLGGSDGVPRHWVDPARHAADFEAALDHVRGELAGEIDPERVALWGTGLSAAVALVVAARRAEVRAVVAQAPQLDPPSPEGLARTRFLLWGGLDLLGMVAPVYVPLYGRPGEWAVASSAQHPGVRDGEGGAPFWAAAAPGPRGGTTGCWPAGSQRWPTSRRSRARRAARRCWSPPATTTSCRSARSRRPPKRSTRPSRVFDGGHYDLSVGPRSAANAAAQAAFLARHLTR